MDDLTARRAEIDLFVNHIIMNADPRSDQLVDVIIMNAEPRSDQLVDHIIMNEVATRRAEAVRPVVKHMVARCHRR